MPQSKELHFFDNESVQWDGNCDSIKERYHSLFPAAEGRLRGEATPIYMYWKPCAERLWRYNPELKLIAILRNPITRAYSHWNMEIARGRETDAFLTAIRSELKQLEGNNKFQHRTHSYVSRGLYCQQILRIRDWFPPESLLILKHDDLLSTPESTLSKVYHHIGASPYPLESPLKRHVGNYREPINEEARVLLHELFRDEIRSLERLLDWNCSSWLEV